MAGIYAVKTYGTTRSQLQLLYQPVINIDYSTQSNMIELANVGNVPALLNVRWPYKGANYAHRPVFPPNAREILTFSGDFAEHGAQVEYESLDGTKWVSRASVFMDQDDGTLHTQMTIERR